MSDKTPTPPPPLKGTVEECPECKERTPHLTAPDGWPFCLKHLDVHPPKREEE